MIKRQKTLEAETLAGFDGAFDLFLPQNLQTGVVFASPHSGSIYPESFTRRSALSLKELRRNEDVFIDALFRPVQNMGAPLLTARFPRCYVDVNRAADEVPDSWTSGQAQSTARANMGLGVIPTQISEKLAIYERTLKPSVTESRLGELYYPYHGALRGLIDTAKDQFGTALLMDCHSMPGFSASGSRRPDIILGDRFGASCQPDTIAWVESLFEGCGYSVTRNHPYAGGYVTAHYGRPETGVESLQIEINRDLYLNPVSLAPNRNYQRLADDLCAVAQAIIDGFGKEARMAAE